MSTDSSKTSRGGTSVLSLLLVAFIVLKLCKVITWSWWWVLSPIWISIIFAIVVVVIANIVNK